MVERWGRSPIFWREASESFGTPDAAMLILDRHQARASFDENYPERRKVTLATVCRNAAGALCLGLPGTNGSILKMLILCRAGAAIY